MKKIIFATLSIYFLASCADEENITEGQNHEISLAQRSADRHLPAREIQDKPDFQVQQNEINGLVARIGAAGDTIGYQAYYNGVKHGPYFDVWGVGFTKHDNPKRADGFFIDGKKDGYFKRFRGPDDPMYISYYEEGEFKWAGWYNLHFEAGLYPAKPFHLEEKGTVSVEAPHPNGTTWFKGTYVDGHPVGVHKFYYSNGQKWGEINYKDSTVLEMWSYDPEDRNTYSFAGDKLWFDEEY